MNNNVGKESSKDKELENIALEFKNVSFGYSNDLLVLKNVSFKIKCGEYVCIIGHNGCGKSTTSKLLTGLLKPRSGSIEIFSEEINENNYKYLRDNVGIVFQNPDNQFIGMFAEDDIAFGLENRKFPKYLMHEIVHKVADQIGILDLLSVEPQKLSGGQKQKVAIASVLAINPKIIIFDESTSMLDPLSKIEIKKLMLWLRSIGKTIVSITHDMDEAANCDNIIVMNHGEIVRYGKPVDIFNDYKFLKDIKLDVPFATKLKLLLQDDLSLSKNVIHSEELISQLCEKVKKL